MLLALENRGNPRCCHPLCLELKRAKRRASQRDPEQSQEPTPD
jgi:hypothetical protein